MAASFYESLEEKSSRLFFCWVLGDRWRMLGVDEVLVGLKLPYWANWINKAYRADTVNSG